MAGGCWRLYLWVPRMSGSKGHCQWECLSGRQKTRRQEARGLSGHQVRCAGGGPVGRPVHGTRSPPPLLSAEE